MGVLSNLLRRVGFQGNGLDQDGGGHGDLAEAEFRIPNMVCEGCAEKIEGVLQAIPGVRAVRPNVAEKRIRVRFETPGVDPQRLSESLAAAGFTAVDPGKS